MKVWVAYGASQDIDGLVPMFLGVFTTREAALARLRTHYITEETGFDPEDPGAAEADDYQAMERVGAEFDAGFSLPVLCANGEVALNMVEAEIE